ncbi:hypothetical protein BH11ACT4_BH11ACT4_08470 [soil metagenome]
MLLMPIRQRLASAAAGLRDARDVWRTSAGRSELIGWMRRRPFVGGLLTVLAGVEMFFSGQLDVGNIHVQVGIEGFQATIIPIGMVLLGTLAVLMPQHRVFYGVLSLVLSVYSLVGVNLGGFFVGMLLGAVGGVLTVAWMPRPAEDSPAEPPPFARRRPSGADQGSTAKKSTAAVAMLLVAGLGGIGAAPAEPTGLCIPLLMSCGSTPGTPPPLIDVPGVVGNLLGGATDADPSTPALPIIPVLDPNAPVFTLPAAQLGGSSISFSGLQAVSTVLVRLADGSQVPVLKLTADDIVIDGFLLDVSKGTGPALVTNSTRMELQGNVQVYLDSATATLLNGTGISIGAQTPPPGNELPPTLLRVNLGLVGVTASSITFLDSHQHIEEGD